MTLSEKINILKQWQFDYFYIIDFDQTVANLKPNTFLQNYIINHQIKHVVCGFDFHFGKKGMGDVHVLQENKSFDVTVIEEYSEDALKVSSSYKKKLINEGKIDTILSCLWTGYLWFAKWKKDWFSYGQY